MYILDGTELGQYTPWRERTGLNPPQKLLPFLSLDNFGINNSTLTADHLSKINGILVKTVNASWTDMRPIDQIRLVGHTDNTGTEMYNFGLGDRRAEAVAAELVKIYPHSGRVQIVLEKSPGETKPTADNVTAQGKALNRRVEVFIVSGGQPIPQGPKKPPCLNVSCLPEPPRRPIIEVPHDTMWDDLPSAPTNKSVRAWLIDLCSRGFPAKACPFMADQVLKGVCHVLEQIITAAGATLTEKQKEELRQKCREAAGKRSSR